MSDYIYNSRDKDLDIFKLCFESRVGDNSGDHEQDYFDVVKMLMQIKKHGSLLDIGSGAGRIPKISMSIMNETIALEPDINRWEFCHSEYHKPPVCQVIPQKTSEYMKDNPSRSFDLIVVGMVIQHMSTTACKSLLNEVKELLKDDGVAIIYTTHTLHKTKGFSFSAGDPNEAYVSEDEFNAYADGHLEQDKGIPVRRFSKDDLLDSISLHFIPLMWRQTSYYKEDKLPFFSNSVNVIAEELKDTGHSQFVVVSKKV